jgi:hypothetical protein
VTAPVADLDSRRLDDAGAGRRLNMWRWLVAPLPWAVVTFALVATAGWPKSRPLIADSIAYRALALGQAKEVLGSIAGRVLHPAAARLVSQATGLNVDQAFLAVALIALALLIGAAAWILRQATGLGALVLPLLFTPVLVREMFGLYYCQDLFYAALLSLFFVVLMKGRRWLALALLFALFLTRESTIVLVVVWAGIAWFESDFLIVAACVAVAMAGLGVSRMFAALGGPNVHHTSEVVFLALKPPFDSLRNLLGIVLVPSEMKGKPGFTCTPFATVHLPRLLSYGSTRQFGICRLDPRIPLATFTLWLSLFGIGPAVLWTLLRCNGRRSLMASPLWLRLAAVYGLLAFFIAPAVSFWLERDIGYSWPAFWLATPVLFKMFCPSASGRAAALLLENLAACWIPYALGAIPSHQGLSSVAALCAALAMQALALWTLRDKAAMCGRVPQPLVDDGPLRRRLAAR